MGIFDWFRRVRPPSAVHPPSASDDAAFSVWGDRATERQNAARPIVAWSDSPVILRHYVHPTISGSPDGNWLDWAARRYFREPSDLTLSIGSGDGGLERHGLAVGLARRFEAFDASAGAVELARRLAQEHHVEDRVEYFVADLNEHCFPDGRYDAAFASMAVHHIRNLEHFFAQVRRALKPGALFIMNEYVGPNQFQWTNRQLELADDLLMRIPERYRRSLLSGHIKVRNNRLPLDHMNAVDPTEAIRSSDIIPLLRTYFDVVEQVDYGGTLLNLALEEITGNFAETPEDLAVLELLFEAERDYLKRGVIPSDFTVLVARKK
jgi:SAM-dependent methyltransferase